MKKNIKIRVRFRIGIHEKNTGNQALTPIFFIYLISGKQVLLSAV